MKRARLAGVALGCALALGCAGGREPPPSDSAAAWLMSIERAHARADAASPDARTMLLEALSVPVPEVVTAEHRLAVHHDLAFRLARIELAQGRSAEALAAADRGLALGRAVSVFTANLLVSRGEALDKLGRRAEAASSYFEALEINRKLLHAALAPRDAGGP